MITNVLRIGTKVVLATCLIVTAVVVAAPLHSVLPESGLDPSWRYALNQAVADRLAFGRDIIFTSGPYAGVYTQMFHPVTDSINMGAGLFFGLCLGVIAIMLLQVSLLWSLGLLYVIAALAFVRDEIFAVYGILLVVAISNLFVDYRNENHSFVRIVIVALMLLPLGLLPLIKGSLILSAGVSIGAASLAFYSAGYFGMALLAIAGPLVAMVGLWVLAGQPIATLPQYYTTMMPLISGYTEAMSIPGELREIVVYLVAAASIIYAAIRVTARPVVKVILLATFGTFLFSAFKGGFVRHDGHALMAGSAIILASVVLNLSLFKTRHALVSTALSAIACFVIQYGYIRSVRDLFYSNLVATYAQSLDGLRGRISGSLNQDFERSVKAIADKADLPKLSGSTDIYSFQQAQLIASGANWRPRPVFQSYTAYTPSLARLNREKLIGDMAPKNIIFRSETIDERWPSMDDGSSWPSLLTNYILVDQHSDFALLRQKTEISEPQITEVFSGEAELGQTVQLPDQAPLYARIQFQPSYFGKFSSLIFKGKPLSMTATLTDGQTKQYRIISGMADVGFIVSPLIENTNEFAALFRGLEFLAGKKLRSIRVDGDGDFWNIKYRLSLGTLRYDPSLKRTE